MAMQFGRFPLRDLFRLKIEKKYHQENKSVELNFDFRRINNKTIPWALVTTELIVASLVALILHTSSADILKDLFIPHTVDEMIINFLNISSCQSYIIPS